MVFVEVKKKHPSLIFPSGGEFIYYPFLSRSTVRSA